MENTNKTLQNLQKSAFGNDIVEGFQIQTVADSMTLERNILISLKIKNGKTFHIKFQQMCDIKTLGEAHFVVKEGFESRLEELLQILSPPATEYTDWNLRKVKFVLGEINTWSKDPSTKVSAALFNGKYQICSAYNGFPPGVADTPERLNNRDIKYKIVQHAEANLISTCARLGIKTEGMSVAVSLFPCASCAGMLISAGIKEIVTVEPSEDAKSRWGEDFKLSKSILEEAGVQVTVIDISKT